MTATPTPRKPGSRTVGKSLQVIVEAAEDPWQDLAQLLWRFDAHIQDRLSAMSETQACGYQLGRGLAETYWALDPDQAAGSRCWDFLLGDERCTELSRLVGRLGAYMTEYTAPAITGSIEVWKYLVGQPAWRGDGQVANAALYHQIRRWYELIVLGQDPTTLIEPAGLMSGVQTVARAVKLFLPELVATIVGLAFLVTLLLLISAGTGNTWEKTVSGILAAAGLSLVSLDRHPEELGAGHAEAAAPGHLYRPGRHRGADRAAAAEKVRPAHGPGQPSAHHGHPELTDTITSHASALLSSNRAEGDCHWLEPAHTREVEGFQWRCMADPEGNELDVLPPKSGS